MVDGDPMSDQNIKFERGTVCEELRHGSFLVSRRVLHMRLGVFDCPIALPK